VAAEKLPDFLFAGCPVDHRKMVGRLERPWTKKGVLWFCCDWMAALLELFLFIIVKT